MINLDEYSARTGLELGDLVRTKQVTSAELADAAQRGIDACGHEINAILEVFSDCLDGSAVSEDGLFAGVPFFLKDMVSGAEGRLQEQGVPAFVGQVVEADAPLVRNFRRAGVNIMGRSAVPPLGWSLDTTSPLHGVTRSPWDLSKTPGGSSGGTAALVAAGITPISMASDGGGSIRIPASFSGLVGLVPTRGRVAMPNINEFGLHIGREGVLSRSVHDTATMLDYISVHEPGDSFIPISPPSRPYSECTLSDPPRLTIGLSTGLWGRGTPCDPEIVSMVEGYARMLESLGHRIVHVQDSDIVDWDAFWNTFLRGSWIGGMTVGDQAEEAGFAPTASSLGYQLWASLELSRSVPASEVRSHEALNQFFNQSVAQMFGRVDVLLTPTTAILPPEAGGKFSALNEMDCLEWMNDSFDATRYTPLANETGIPAISLPVGLSQSGLPVGAQLYAPWAREDLLLALSAETERANPGWFTRRPPVHVSREALGSTSPR